MSPPSSDSDGVVHRIASSPSGNVLFLKAWLRSPLSIASLMPSSQATGRTFARMVDSAREGEILELGSGTGAISGMLLEAGIPPRRLIMVEREAELAAYLQRRFPDVRVLHGDATAIAEMLRAARVRRLAAVVSSLPIVWFPLEDQTRIIESCMALLGPGGEFFQMTNQPASPLPLKKLALRGERAAAIWRNFPPSFIWRYWRD